MSSTRTQPLRLPDAFVQRLRDSWGPLEVDRMLAGMRAPRPVTLRVNTLRTNVRATIAALWQAGIKVERVSWYPDALIVKNARESRLEALPEYRDGHFYLQSLSSMVPPLVLAPRPGERVLDVAAAPGSKTTQMAAMMENRGAILAIETSAVRAERLRFNLQRQQVTIAEVRVGDGRRLGPGSRGQFDRVLLDAPCSGEGRFVMGDVSTYRHWSERLVRRLVPLQRQLLSSALRAVRPGGVVVYSTCTINPDENEGVVEWALGRYGDALEVLPIELALPARWPGLTGGGGHPALRLALRIPPSATMEGFFVCKLRVKRPLQTSPPDGSPGN
ncbi:RsmB/NOP family class I SAM-dependent RNA methyltransferase [Carboxydochorda subterranea]|uniref:RsmB/NOP family class I SAM-dependent RNA methyltransferase n=1 Tax=Carboxydichorda subterranea TaxID=3109565 RepID=A0ABZ1BX19_9FIRM|nr:RsmB/NOP family class I SAM-dependent RNA methyltransferase [Limnochorda sp. L945t]WRP17211.1 RsmB/NOP family class I SAM-dependent RNA methyltransferase [Limnochorda sp. L945t]